MSSIIAAVPPLHYNYNNNSNNSNDIEMGIHSRASSSTFSPHLPPRGNTIFHIRPVVSKFVVQAPVSRSILKEAEFTENEEFTHLQYTAVTCEPEEFVSLGYKLRTLRYKRKIKIALVMTMYNENEDLFTKSMLNVQKNIDYICQERKWGKEGWKNFVVIIVADGRKKINPRVLHVLNVMGLYNENLVRNLVDNKPVKAHLFEYTTQIGVDRKMNVVHRNGTGNSTSIPPTQVVFILKENNAKKINSHKWFFEAVCESLDPEVCMLLDVGTKPEKTSLWHLWRSFERNPMIGGSCGEIVAEIGRFGSKLINPLVASQNFEYKMSNILDKPLESVFGYISVLPGAFSAYRYKALKGRPLEQYFLGENPAASIFTSNLYLAEDRILCFELITKKNEAWLLKYVKSARAETDVPDRLPELTSQRRRWLNGSFFASVHALINFRQIFQSSHSSKQKMLFVLEFLYNLFNLYFTWFSLANFYLSFFFLFDVRNVTNGVSLSVSDIDPFFPFGAQVSDLLRGIYTASIVSMFITALGNRPQGMAWLYYTISVFFSCLMAFMLFMGGWTIRIQVVAFNNANGNASIGNALAYAISTPAFRDLVIAVVSTYGLYFLSSLMHLDPWHCFSSMIQYLLVLPTYNNIFMIYSFCNLHDVTWGTKGSTTLEESKSVKVSKGEDGTKVFEYEAVSMEQEDIDQEWKIVQRKIIQYAVNPVQESNQIDEKTIKEDGTKSFRTKIVLSWIFCNLVLVVIFTNQLSLEYLFPRRTSAINPYLTFLFWSVAIISFIRALGSSIYMIQWYKEKKEDAALLL